jgi:hypothetical protein
MIPAAADWISVPLKDRGMHERKGWLFQSEVAPGEIIGTRTTLKDAAE